MTLRPPAKRIGPPSVAGVVVAGQQGGVDAEEFGVKPA